MGGDAIEPPTSWVKPAASRNDGEEPAWLRGFRPNGRAALAGNHRELLATYSPHSRQPSEEGCRFVECKGVTYRAIAARNASSAVERP